MRWEEVQNAKVWFPNLKHQKEKILFLFLTQKERWLIFKALQDKHLACEVY